MAALRMNCGETIALLSSAAFRRSAAGLKYPYSSVLRFPAKNSYDGVTAARSNNNSNENFLKVKEEGGGEVSIMLGKTKMIGPREDVEAAAVRAIRYGSRGKMMIIGLLLIGYPLVLIYILKSNFGLVIRYCKSWYTSVTTGSGLTAVATFLYPLFLVTFSLVISKPTLDKINQRLKVMVEQERMKLEFVRNQETKVLLRALQQEIKVNPAKIAEMDSETKQLLTYTFNHIKHNTETDEELQRALLQEIVNPAKIAEMNSETKQLLIDAYNTIKNDTD